MAAPITSIHRTEESAEKIQADKLAELQTLLAEHDSALQQILEITGELHDIGVIDGLQAMIKAKEEIAKIAVDQTSREPITNLINHAINASAMISAISPDTTEKLSNSVKSGLETAEAEMINSNKVGIIDLMKAINDPDINRAMKFGLSFLKGMGKELDGDY